MADLPDWIDDRIDRNLDNTLTQEHVVETMVESERPFFSIRQIQARVKPDVSKATVRNRLNELEEIDVVATETYPESVTLYYIDHDESNWPLSPEGKRALATDPPHDRPLLDALGPSDPAGLRRLALAGLLTVTVASGVATAVGMGLVLGVGNVAGLAGVALAGGGLAVFSVSLEVLFFGLVLFGTDRVAR